MNKEETNEIINTLISVSQSIEETYNNLLNLELKGLKDSKEYSIELTKLTSTLSLEDSLYDKIKNQDTLTHLISELSY